VEIAIAIADAVVVSGLSERIFASRLTAIKIGKNFAHHPEK
jgi:hypothetical protein